MGAAWDLYKVTCTAEGHAHQNDDEVFTCLLRAAAAVRQARTEVAHD